MKKLTILLFFILSMFLYAQNGNEVEPGNVHVDRHNNITFYVPPMVIYNPDSSKSWYWNGSVTDVSSESILDIIMSVYDSSLGANDVIVLNAEQYHYTSGAPLVDVTDAAVETAYVHYNTASYNFSTIAINFDDSTTARFYSSIYGSPDFTDETDGNWGDITNAVVGADSVDYGTNTNFYITDVLSPNEWVLIKYTKRGNTNSIKIGVKKRY